MLLKNKQNNARLQRRNDSVETKGMEICFDLGQKNDERAAAGSDSVRVGMGWKASLLAVVWCLVKVPLASAFDTHTLFEAGGLAGMPFGSGLEYRISHDQALGLSYKAFGQFYDQYRFGTSEKSGRLGLGYSSSVSSRPSAKPSADPQAGAAGEDFHFGVEGSAAASGNGILAPRFEVSLGGDFAWKEASWVPHYKLAYRIYSASEVIQAMMGSEYYPQRSLVFWDLTFSSTVLRAFGVATTNFAGVLRAGLELPKGYFAFLVTALGAEPDVIRRADSSLEVRAYYSDTIGLRFRTAPLFTGRLKLELSTDWVHYFDIQLDQVRGSLGVTWLWKE